MASIECLAGIVFVFNEAPLPLTTVVDRVRVVPLQPERVVCRILIATRIQSFRLQIFIHDHPSGQAVNSIPQEH